LFIWTRPYRAYPEYKYLKGFSVCISEFKINAGSFLTRLKTGNYLLYQLSYLKAKEKGLDEAIILNQQGYLAEASRSNIFLIKEKTLFTPSLECGCLKGITRKVIMDIARKNNIEVKEGCFTLEDLYNSEEAFLTNSLMGVMPLNTLEKRRIGSNKFKLTRFLNKEYNYLLRYGK
ncbi:MAG: aminotransferase class IV, partial [Candidatus Omnitrophica bacterium]|nr:aminotransferase class IV [Candidatus Omnitrophota bacterium]